MTEPATSPTTGTRFSPADLDVVLGAQLIVGWAGESGEEKGLGSPSFWTEAALWQEIRDSLPNYRQSKFQPLMPDWVQREVVSDSLLDADGARYFLLSSIPCKVGA